MPLYVTFGDKEYRAGVDLSSDDFWRELTAAGRAFPKTAAAAAGLVSARRSRACSRTARTTIIYVGVGSKLSATVASAKVARDDAAATRKHVYIVDSASASMGVTLLAAMAVGQGRTGKVGAERSWPVERRRDDVKFYVVLETLEYLKRGGRISPARAAIGNVLSVKPIITRRGRHRRDGRPTADARKSARTPAGAAQREKAEQVWHAARPG